MSIILFFCIYIYLYIHCSKVVTITTYTNLLKGKMTLPLLQAHISKRMNAYRTK